MIVTVFKGCYPYFSLLAFFVIIWRIRTGLWNRRETVVLACFLGHLLLEILQLAVGDGKWDFSRRYLLPTAPLLFAWTAYGLWSLYRKYRMKIPMWSLWSVAVLLIVCLLYDGLAPSLKNYYSKRKKGAAKVIAVAVPWIKAHDSGLPPDTPPRHLQMYRSPYRPVVKSDFPALGFLAGGRSEPSPFEDIPDFWVLVSTLPVPEGSEKCHEFSVGMAEYIIYRRRTP